MRAGPLSNSTVISLLNRCFVPVYAVNEDYRDGGAQPPEEKAEYNRIYKEALAAKLSAGTVHVYILSPDGHAIDSLHVATAAKTERLIDLLERTIKKLKVRQGQALVAPPETSAHGALLKYITTSDPRHFQPINTNYGLFPPLPARVRDKQERQRRIGQRALEDFGTWMQRSGLS